MTVEREEDPDPGLLSSPALTCSLSGCGVRPLNVLGGTGEAGPGGPRLIRRAVRKQWCPGLAAQNPLFFLGSPQVSVGLQNVGAQRPTPEAEAMGPLEV